MNVIDIDGVRYQKSNLAGKEVGYTSDYVGQLARAGKVEARQIGRAWYVREGELVRHKKENLRSNKEKSIQYAERFRKDVEQGQIHNALYVPDAGSGFRKRLLDTAVTYENDHGPLILEPRKYIDEVKEVDLVEDEPLPSEDKEIHIPVRSLEETEHTSAFVTEVTQAPVRGTIPVHEVLEEEEAPPPVILKDSAMVPYIPLRGGSMLPAARRPVSIVLVSTLSVFFILMFAGVSLLSYRSLTLERAGLSVTATVSYGISSEGFNISSKALFDEILIKMKLK